MELVVMLLIGAALMMAIVIALGPAVKREREEGRKD